MENANDQRIIKIAGYESARDNIPKILTGTVREFYDRCCTPDIYQYKDERQSQATKKLSYGFSFADFGDNPHPVRCDEDVNGLLGISLDLEQKEPGKHPSKELICQELEGIEFVAFTTNQHTPKAPRFRVPIIFSQMATKEQYLNVYGYFSLKFPGLLDPCVSSFSQMAFFPYIPDIRSKYFESFEGHGKFFDPSSLDADSDKYRRVVHKLSQPQGKKSKKKARNRPSSIDLVNIDDLRISYALKQKIISGDPKRLGKPSRSELICSLVLDLKRQVKGITDEQIAGVLLNPAYGVCAKPLEYSDPEGWVLGDIERVQQKYGGWLIEGEEPYFPPEDTLPLPDAERALEKAVASFPMFGVEVLGIKTTPGLGKTEVYGNLVANREPGEGLVEIYVPRHDLAEELKYQRLEPKNPNLKINVIAGRSRIPNGSDEPLCRRHALAKLMNDLNPNQSVRGTLCENEENQCPYFEGCRYLAQFKSKDDVRIFVHSHLPLPRDSQSNQIPDYAIIDESFFDKLLSTDQYKLIDAQTSYLPSEIKLVLDLVVRKDMPLFKELQKQTDNIEQLLNDAQVNLWQIGQGGEIEPNMSDSLIRHRLSNAKNVQMESKVLEALLQEYQYISTLEHDNPRREYSLCVRKNDSNHFAVCTRRDLSRFTILNDYEEQKIPVLYVDADLDPNISSIFLGDIKLESIQVERNAHIVQCYSTTNAKSRFDKKSKQYALSDIKKHRAATDQLAKHFLGSSKKRTMLIIGYKGVMKLRLKSRQNPDKPVSAHKSKRFALIHFGNLRGIDKHKDKDLCVVVGRHQLPIHALENKAAALWWDSDEELYLPGDYETEIRGYNVRYGRRCGVKVLVHPDPKVQRLQEQFRECETLQGIDRIRSVRAEEQKKIVILSNVPLPLIVDEIISYNDILSPDKIEQVLPEYPEHVMPLSPDFLCKHHPSIFASNEATRKTVSRFRQCYFHKGEGIFTFGGHQYVLISYCINGKRGGHPKQCLADRTLGKRNIIRQLEKLHRALIDLIE